jgi:endogenous inhibitor of DNA gyrase (YacG/DUF329 family)
MRRMPSFIFDRPACPSCGAPMAFVSRSPHPTLDITWERVTYECAKCDKLHTRAINLTEPDVPRAAAE